MSDRTQLNWRVPVREWAQFERAIREKHGRLRPYTKFEIEEAMREFLDEDGLLAEAEDLLRTHTDLLELSSSTDAYGTSYSRGGATRKVTHRVSAELKERFQIFADKHEATSYGRLLGAALRVYADGGRARRLLEDVEALVTGGTTDGSTDGSVESQSGDLSTAGDRGTTPGPDASPDVDAALVLEIAEDLPDQFPTDLLRKKTVAKLQSEYDELPERRLEAYTDAVVNSLGVVEHPVKEGVYIPEEDREDYTVFSDLEREEKEVYLRRILVAEALEDGRLKHAVGYKEVMALIDEYLHERPSTQHAYDLMEDSALASPAFSYGKRRGASRKQLQVDLTEVHDQTLAGAVDLRMDLSQEDIADVLGPIVADSDTPRAATDGGAPLSSTAKD